MLDGGARANADSTRSSRACGTTREARSGFVPSAAARLAEDYVALLAVVGPHAHSSFGAGVL